MTRPLKERFWEKVDKLGDCWEWIAARNPRGYGLIIKSGIAEKAHRVSYELNISDIPEGMCICHHCDNPGCVNPDHLFLGNHADNMHDMADKGRARYRVGEAVNTAKLTVGDVRLIRQLHAAGLKNKYSAELFDVELSRISKIALRKSWKHVS